MSTKLYAMEKRQEEMAAGPDDGPLPTIDEAMARHIECALPRTMGASRVPTGLQIS